MARWEDGSAPGRVDNERESLTDYGRRTLMILDKTCKAFEMARISLRNRLDCQRSFSLSVVVISIICIIVPNLTISIGKDSRFGLPKQTTSSDRDKERALPTSGNALSL